MKRTHAQAAFNNNATYRPHWVVDGQVFADIPAVQREVVKRGGTATLGSTKNRLHAGASTWAELLKPLNEKMSKTRKQMAADSRAEVAEIVRQMDARKRAMGLTRG